MRPHGHRDCVAITFIAEACDCWVCLRRSSKEVNLNRDVSDIKELKAGL